MHKTAVALCRTTETRQTFPQRKKIFHQIPQTSIPDEIYTNEKKNTSDLRWTNTTSCSPRLRNKINIDKLALGLNDCGVGGRVKTWVGSHPSISPPLFLPSGCRATDERLFWKLRHCRHHVLDELLPPESDTQYNLKKRRHNLTLPEKKGHLAAKNFIIRLLYKETY